MTKTLDKLAWRPAKVGDTFTIERLGKCVIIAVYSAGTIDVEAESGNCYRITGLDFI